MNFKILLFSAFAVSGLAATAQNENKGYAITGNGTKDYMWMNIRSVDLSTGKITGNVFELNKTNFTLTDVAAKSTTNQSNVQPGEVYGSALYPTSSFVAAAAYDRRTNKLFFTPMRRGELRWADMNVKNGTPAFYTMSIPGYTASAPTNEDQNITRMVIGSNGYGYAITNDGSHLYRFTTGKSPVITDLGGLVDDESNKGLSIHNKCSSWGGDMIADAFGKLYIISATRNVFVVDAASRITTHKGAISGLPGTYTTNGAAVDANGDVILSSATMFDGYYKMNINDLTAVKMEGSDVVYNSSDLAGGNLLFQKEADKARVDEFGKVPPTAASNGGSIIYPNPIVSNQFNILLDGKCEGQYSIVVADLAGRPLQSSKTGLTKGQAVYRVSLASRPARGTYVVSVINEKGVIVLSDKVVVL